MEMKKILIIIITILYLSGIGIILFREPLQKLVGG